MGMISSAWGTWMEASGLLKGSGVFISGTDTGVGKTWTGKQLAAFLRVLGREVIPRKPVESGWDPDVARTDAWQLANAAGLPLDDAHREATLLEVCPTRFKAALSPPRAADLEGQRLELVKLAAACPTRCKHNEFLLVEGAGGFYSPIAHDGSNADLAQILGLPVVLVSEDRVGCINQVMMAAEAVNQKGLQLAGVILNKMNPAPDHMDNLRDLRVKLRVPIVQTGVTA